MKNNDKKQFIILSGLPRTGSSLLVAMLTQNPKIYGEGASALCQLMWDAKQVCDNVDAISANHRFHTKHDILSALPNLYYKNANQPIIVEKGRTWAHPLNFDMWLNHVDENQKIIVMTRNVEEIVKSMASLRIKNGWSGDVFSDLVAPSSEPICRAAEGIFFAKKAYPERLIFVDYEDIVCDPLGVINKIYEAYGIEKYDHSISDINVKNPENDEVHGLIGMHDVRSTISTRSIDIELPDEIKAICAELNAIIYDDNQLKNDFIKLSTLSSEG